MLDRIRRRLTMGYVGVLALILTLFSTIVVASFYRQSVAQQDELLAQRAQSEAKDLFYGNLERKLVSDNSEEYGWVALDPAGRVLDLDPTARSLGLPSVGLAKMTVKREKAVADTIRGPDGDVRVVSIPVVQSGVIVGVMQSARSLGPVRETVRTLALVLGPIGLGALALAAAGGLFMSRRAMRPVQDAFDRQRTFIADASHELKTPLTLIRADAEVLLRGMTNPDDRELVEDLLGETDRMSAVLSDLLILARLDAGKLAVAREIFDLGATVAETAERFGARANARDVRLEVRSTGELPVRGDPERTAQILAALLDNALRFTPPGVGVEVSARAQDGRACATVTDTGPGIAPEHLPRVFDRFYRAEASRTRSEAGGGTGLGLSIARELARAQGGELTAANAPDGGARFTLSLPNASP
ncbi:MAG: HAMP domain-containing histidine kinase [Actinomycetota bacterium]|nr:HAMP domain-containing histidine kinase [Actinomycetota bacterium]MDQ5818599.1 HAMP domain-containing histidine kinase [Actinomycetota bacterium]